MTIFWPKDIFLLKTKLLLNDFESCCLHQAIHAKITLSMCIVFTRAQRHTEKKAQFEYEMSKNQTNENQIISIIVIEAEQRLLNHNLIHSIIIRPNPIKTHSQPQLFDLCCIYIKFRFLFLLFSN